MSFHPASFAHLLAGLGFAVLLALGLNLLLARPSAAQPPPAAAPSLSLAPAPAAIAVATSIAAPAAEPTEWFSATAMLTSSAAVVTVGDALTVTAQLVTTGTCGFALYDVTLGQAKPLLAHVEPPGSVIGPPGPNPAAWRLAAWQSGVTTFTVDFYGETNCNDAWQWTTVRAESQPVTVTGFFFAMPFVSRSIPQPQITNLGALDWPYNANSTAYDINNSGQIVGESRSELAQRRAFLWQNGVMTNLGVLGGAYSYAKVINERGQVIGNSATAAGQDHAFFWAGGSMTDVGTLGGSWSDAVDMNLHGQVIGNSITPEGHLHGFIWANGVITDLGTLGGDNTTARDINDRGQVVGFTTSGDGSNRAFLWENGAMNDLGLDSAAASSAKAINERGQVAGGIVSNGQQLGFLWEQGVITYFAGLGGNLYRIDALSERGQVLGYNTADDAMGIRAFLWEAGKVTDLDTRGNRWTCAALMNSAGQIILDRFSEEAPWGTVLWRNGRFAPLAALVDAGDRCALAINDLGQVVGWSSAIDVESRAVLWKTFQ